MKYTYESIMTERDYEWDIAGIVYNANYLHYPVNTRHLFLQHCGLSFADMHRKGVDAVVARMNLKFKTPLVPDDTFISRLAVKKDGIKYVFYQDLFRERDEKLCFSGVIEIVCLVNGRLANSDDYDKALAKHFS